MGIWRLLMRVGVGALLIGHGTQKLLGWFGGDGIDGTAKTFERIGLYPGRPNAVAAGIAEAGGGALLAAGIEPPLGAAMVTGAMLTAIRRVHGHCGSGTGYGVPGSGTGYGVPGSGGGPGGAGGSGGSGMIELMPAAFPRARTANGLASTDTGKLRFDRTKGGKPFAAICHGPWMLVEAGIARDHTLTSRPSLETDIRNAGGTWEDRDVVEDDDVVTSRRPEDIPAFNKRMIPMFADGTRCRSRKAAATR